MKPTNNKADFNFFVPIDFEKSVNKKGEKVMKIKGIASTPDEDSEGETLLPVGFDLTRFLNIGYLNYNHGAKNDASKIIGEPTVAKITQKGELYVEGVLYNGHPLAESVWNMAEILEKNGSSRRMGFSIEGRAIERDPINPKRIIKALLTGLAITPTPVNSSTYMDLCKGVQENDFVEYEYDNEAILEKAENSKYLYEFSVKGKNYGITKSFEMEVIEKDMDVAATSALHPESLDKKLKNLEPNLKKAILDGIVPIQDVSRILKESGPMDDILKKALLLDIIPIDKADTIMKGKKAEIGEIREFGGQKYQKQPDKTWKPIGERDPNFKEPERKKTWISFMPYKDSSRLPESIKRMTGEEVKVLLENKIKKRDNSMTSSSAKSMLREEIWDLEKVMEAHAKAISESK